MADEVAEIRTTGRPMLRVVGPVKGEDVAAEEHLTVEMFLERLHDHVARAGELGGNLVRELQLRSH